VIRPCPVLGLLFMAPLLAGCVTAAAPYDPVAAKAESDRKVSAIVSTYTQRIQEIEAEADRQIAARAAEQKALCKKKGGVGIGMTREQVRASCWGKPEKINITTNVGGDHEQWVYPGFQYVYLRNGVVTSIQTSR